MSFQVLALLGFSLLMTRFKSEWATGAWLTEWEAEEEGERKKKCPTPLKISCFMISAHRCWLLLLPVDLTSCSCEGVFLSAGGGVFFCFCGRWEQQADRRKFGDWILTLLSRLRGNFMRIRGACGPRLHGAASLFGDLVRDGSVRRAPARAGGWVQLCTWTGTLAKRVKKKKKWQTASFQQSMISYTCCVYVGSFTVKVTQPNARFGASTAVFSGASCSLHSLVFTLHLATLSLWPDITCCKWQPFKAPFKWLISIFDVQPHY